MIGGQLGGWGRPGTVSGMESAVTSAISTYSSSRIFLVTFFESEAAGFQEGSGVPLHWWAPEPLMPADLALETLPQPLG